MDSAFLAPLVDIIIAPYKERIRLLEEELHESKKKHQHSYRSADCSLLSESLALAQSIMPIAQLRKENKYYLQPFADLQSIVEASRPALTKYNLAIVQDIITQDDGSQLLITMLLHSSNQYIESRIRLVPPKSDIHTIKSYIDLWKRIAYASLIGVISPFDDDDGEIAMMPERQKDEKGTGLNTDYNPRENKYETITKEQLEQLHYELDAFPDIAQQILDGLHLHALADMPKAKFQNAIDRVRKIKYLRKNN